MKSGAKPKPSVWLAKSREQDAAKADPLVADPCPGRLIALRNLRDGSEIALLKRDASVGDVQDAVITLIGPRPSSCSSPRRGMEALSVLTHHFIGRSPAWGVTGDALPGAGALRASV